MDEDGNNTEGYAEISIAKHRNGALKDIPLRFISNYAKFADFDSDSIDSPNLDPNINFENNQAIKTVPSKMNDMEEDDTPF